jgi:hypothetical protein
MSRPTRSQLRRHSRRLARDGYQPMMIVNSGSDLPETAATALFRVIWRYRPNSPRSPLPQQRSSPRTPSTAPTSSRGPGLR